MSSIYKLFLLCPFSSLLFLYFFAGGRGAVFGVDVWAWAGLDSCINQLCVCVCVFKGQFLRVLHVCVCVVVVVHVSVWSLCCPVHFFPFHLLTWLSYNLGVGVWVISVSSLSLSHAHTRTYQYIFQLQSLKHTLLQKKFFFFYCILIKCCSSMSIIK